MRWCLVLYLSLVCNTVVVVQRDEDTGCSYSSLLFYETKKYGVDDAFGFVRARTQFRKAQLHAKRNAELAQQQERELLFANQDEEGVKQRLKDQRGGGGGSVGARSKDDVVVNASSDVTAALRRTHQLMQSELSRSQFAHDTLRGSTFTRAMLGHISRVRC